MSIAVSAGTKHLQRYLRNRSGETVEEIAKKDGVTERAIQNSLRQVALQRAHLTTEFLRESLVGIVIDNGRKVDFALDQALSATTTTEVIARNGEKKTVKVPDHETRMEAVDRFVAVAEAALPKGGGHNINVNATAGASASVRQASGVYVGAEDRMRNIRDQMKNAPQLVGKTVVGNILEKPAIEMVSDEEDEEEDADS